MPAPRRTRRTWLPDAGRPARRTAYHRCLSGRTSPPGAARLKSERACRQRPVNRGGYVPAERRSPDGCDGWLLRRRPEPRHHGHELAGAMPSRLGGSTCKRKRTSWLISSMALARSPVGQQGRGARAAVGAVATDRQEPRCLHRPPRQADRGCRPRAAHRFVRRDLVREESLRRLILLSIARNSSTPNQLHTNRRRGTRQTIPLTTFGRIPESSQ